MTAVPQFAPLGDAAALVRITGGDANLVARALAESLAEATLHGIVDAAPAYDAVGVYFDPLITSHAEVREAVLAQLQILDAHAEAPAELHEIPVVYDGPDLDQIARRLGLTPERIIELHAGREYTALAVGFVPGFAYLGEVDAQLRLPRRDSPRPRVPPGSVAIAGSHTAVYPFTTPGGWHLLGRTDAVLFDPARPQPALLRAGSRVRFMPV